MKITKWDYIGVASIGLLFIAYSWVVNPFHQTLSACVEKQATKNGFVGTYDDAVEVYRDSCKKTNEKEQMINDCINENAIKNHFEDFGEDGQDTAVKTFYQWCSDKIKVHD